MLDCAINLVKNGNALGSGLSMISMKNENRKYRWTADISNLVELAYAISEAGSVNNGEVEITDFVRFLGEIFGINIRRCSDFYYKMRTRSGSRTAFLSRLIKLLEARMDRDDEKNYRR